MNKTIKKSIFITILTLMTIVMAVILVGCNKVDKKLQSMQNNISYFNNQMLVGEDSNFYVEVVDGSREKTLIADGEVGEMAEYCTINVTPINLDMTNRVLTFKLTGENGVYEGSLEKSIIGINYNANVEEPQKLGTLKNVTIALGEQKFEYNLSSINANGIDYKKAVESVYNNCAEDLESMFDGNSFKSEIYIKISCDRSKNPKEYFWFVNVVENSDNMFCVLIDMQTGEVIAKKHR